MNLEPLVDKLNSLLAEGKISIELHTEIYLSAKTVGAESTRLVVDQLTGKLKHWEEIYEGDDKSLYTLGLRHAIDIITGEDATDYNGFNGKPYEQGQEFVLDEEVTE